MKSKAAFVTPQINGGEFSEYARNCAALSTEKQINLQTMRYKDSSPLNLKRLLQQQQQSCLGQQSQLPQVMSPNKGLQFYLNNQNKLQTERINKHLIEQNLGNELQMTKQKQNGSQQLLSLDTIRKVSVEKRLKLDKENNMSLLPYPSTTTAKQQTLRVFRSKENNIFSYEKKNDTTSQIDGNFTEDLLFSHSKNEVLSNTKNEQKLKLQIPLQELNEKENDKNKKQSIADFKKLVLNTSLSVSSRNRNNISLKNMNTAQQVNQQSQLLGYHTLRNRQHANRKSERLTPSVEQENQNRIIQRHSFQICEQTDQTLTDDNTIGNQSEKPSSQINIRKISNKLFESNYSLQNKSIQFTSNINNLIPFGSTAKSQERVFPNNGSKQQLLQTNRNVLSSERQVSSNFNNMSSKSEQNKFNFDSLKLTSESSCRNFQSQSEGFIKEIIDQGQQKNFNNFIISHEQPINNQNTITSPVTAINMTSQTTKHLNELNSNFFQLNFKNFNINLKQQLKTASNFNNLNKDKSELLKKTKMIFSSKQQKNIEPLHNHTSQSNQFFSSSSNQVPLSPLASKDMNLTQIRLSTQRQRISKSPYQLNNQCQAKVEVREVKKQNKRGSSLVEQLEFEYNNLYYNSNQSAIFINQNQNTSTLALNNVINSSPQIQANYTPSQSFTNFNNNPKSQKRVNQQTSQLFSQISTFTNLNLLENDDDQIVNPNFELNKLTNLQKAPSLILASPSLSKHGTVMFDQQPYSHLNCKEIQNYFGDMRRALQKEIQDDELFISIIEKKLLINIEQFLYFLSHFWKFCIENYDKNENDFAIFKIEEKYLNKITEVMNSVLQQQKNISREKIAIFINSFQFHSQRLILPKNLFEHIGGQKQAQKLINDLINRLKFDISIGVQLGKVLNEIDHVKAGQVFCSFLKDDIDGIKDSIVYANKELNITQVEFFLIKQTIYDALMAEKLIRKDHKMMIIEKFEKLRAFVLQDHTQLNLLQDQIIHEALMIKIRNNKSILKYLKNKERQGIIDFSQFTFSMIFGRTTIFEYVEKLRNEILNLSPQQFISSTDQVIEDNEDDFIKQQEDLSKQEKLLKVLKEIEELTLESVNDFMDLSSIYNTEKQMKLKFQFVKEHITQQFSKVKNKGRTIIKELRIWAVSNFKKYLKNIEMTEGENGRLDVMDSILKYYFYRQSDVFSFYDVPIAINYFPITRNAVEYWLTGLRNVLKDDRFNLTVLEVDELIEQISSLFSLRWVKKKNQLYFINPPKV